CLRVGVGDVVLEREESERVQRFRQSVLRVARRAREIEVRAVRERGRGRVEERAPEGRERRRVAGGRGAAAAVRRRGAQHVGLGGERPVELQEGGGRLERREARRQREEKTAAAVPEVGGGAVEEPRDVAVHRVFAHERRGIG